MQTRTSMARKEKKMGTVTNRALIIHGWTYSLEKYKKIQELLTVNGLKTNILKVPGLTEKIDRAWNINDYIDWLKRIIDKEKNKVVLIGHSNGGRIAASYASKYPQKLAHLILIDSAGILHDELHVKLRLLFWSTFVRIGKRITSSAILKNLLYRLLGENDYNTATPQAKKTMISLIKSDLSFILDKIKTPTLIIWGKLDKVTPINDGKIIHKLIKNSKLHIVKDARHSPHFTHAEEVADIILKYLKTQNYNVRLKVN